jgi:hypothetical protein
MPDPAVSIGQVTPRDMINSISFETKLSAGLRLSS